MNTQLKKLRRIAIFLAGIFAASIPATASAEWTIKGLGFLDEIDEIFIGSYATDINDSGQVVGTNFNSVGVSRAFITGPNGIGMTDLGTLGGYRSDANAISRQYPNHKPT
ncbi:hypothetical protein [Nitrosomonas sp.]|uniref:hypothetical protein n=1 Tax=Nitrosomonas sp. TaxID=42353 RepID=UPI0025D6D09E|nr:hypothetical protein [Nitrosomonas sp.]